MRTLTQAGTPQKGQLLLIVFIAVLIAAIVSHVAASKFGLQTGKPTYRRIGPSDGPQVLCAGSSLLQFGLSWPEVSKIFGQGIEAWAVAGSSPEIWEVSQSLATNANTSIIGVSVYDLNEHRLSDSRAHIVPLAQTISDLWHSNLDWAFSKRVISQYPLAYLRVIFPTAGRSDAVLVGIRRMFRDLAGLAPSAEDQGNSLVLPSRPVLEFGAATERVSEWPRDKILRRLAMQRSEIQGLHTFDGPKKLAFLRMLHRAQKGRTIVAVMPVAPSYARELLTYSMIQDFEETLADAQRANTNALFIRLDQVSGLSSDEYFSDLVHLNGAGRDIATEAFIQELKRQSTNR